MEIKSSGGNVDVITYECANIIILNKNGEIIENFEKDNLTTYGLKNSEKLLTYQINNNSLIWFEPSDNTEYKFTVSRDILRKEVVKHYSSNEIIQAGK